MTSRRVWNKLLLLATVTAGLSLFVSASGHAGPGAAADGAAGSGLCYALLVNVGPLINTANFEPGEGGETRPDEDLTGSWTWEGTTESAIPPFIVEMIGQGIVPEGDITYLTCEDSGELELVQTGDTFEGTATQILSCMTEGGQGPFSPPAFPPQFQVTNGLVSGKDTSFNFGTCDFTAKVAGSGDKLMGEGVCAIPLPPPYFLILTKWRAQR